MPDLAMRTLQSLLVLNCAAGPDQTRKTAIAYGALTSILVFLLLLLTGCGG